MLSILRGWTGGGGTTFVAVVKEGIVRGMKLGTGALSGEECSDVNWDKKLRSSGADISVCA